MGRGFPEKRDLLKTININKYNWRPGKELSWDHVKAERS
jgi:hypothetical protein